MQYAKHVIIVHTFFFVKLKLYSKFLLQTCKKWPNIISKNPIYSTSNLDL